MIRALLVIILLIQATHAASYDPAWASIPPKRVIRHAGGDGAALVKVVEALQPGDCLEMAVGTYSVDRMWDLRVHGSAEAPIWIVAAKDAQVIITRPDDKQNIINIGQGGPVSYLCLRGIEFTGGSHGMRLGQCKEVWIDQCHIHHTGAVCLSANSANSSHLFLTRNHIHHGSGHGEGMYLGGNNASFIMSESVIALNHIHNCGGSQGDGIEVKQGSWGNLIAENHVHDTQYPCITVYGTAGKPVNIVERNLCYRSGDHVMQVQGEAIVRNNVLISGKSSGFGSTDHQGKTTNLQVIHNTIINTGHAFSGGSWNAREGMILANNILYSRDGNALHFANGHEGVTLLGNIVLGSGLKEGCHPGRSLEQDLPGLTWDAEKHDATPAADAPFPHAEKPYLLPDDIHETQRTSPLSGAVTR
ncbi:MAG: right-handed parallel beta-helix repeat-containing protein [Verrucomicrobiota bacterium]